RGSDPRRPHHVRAGRRTARLLRLAGRGHGRGGTRDDRSARADPLGCRARGAGTGEVRVSPLGPLANRGAVVTGGGRGIGAAIAERLADAGASVIVAARTAAEVESVAASLRARGGRVWGVPCDVADEAQVRTLGARAFQHAGAIDILVNAAGDAGSGPFE